MKTINRSIPFLLIALCSCFWGCGKLSDSQKQEIERYKNSPRDPRLIGQWKIMTKKNEFVIDFRQDGRVMYGLPVYDENNKITHYKNDKQEVYFYTEKDSIIKYYEVRGGFYGVFDYEERYKIDKDTLYKYLYGFENKGVKVNIDIKKS